MKEHLQFNYDIDAPWVFLEVAKNQGMTFSQQQIHRIKLAVAYDIARGLEFSEQGIFICNEVLAEARQILEKKQKRAHLRAVK